MYVSDIVALLLIISMAFLIPFTIDKAEDLDSELEVAKALNSNYHEQLMECKTTVNEPCVIRMECADDMDSVVWLEHQRQTTLMPKVYPEDIKKEVGNEVH